MSSECENNNKHHIKIKHAKHDFVIKQKIISYNNICTNTSTHIISTFTTHSIIVLTEAKQSLKQK